MLSLFLELIRHIFAAVGMVGTKNNFPKALTREEEAALVARLSSGDTAARDELIERNLRLVAHIAKKYSGRGRDSDDLISIGSIGLVKAIGTFNTEKGGSVAAYAARCIENEILMYIRKNSSLRQEMSIDEPLNVDWDGNELLLSDVLGTDDDEVCRPLEDDADKQMLTAAIRTLSERERSIIVLRFGLDGKNELTQKEVADLMGISQSYISRLEKRIIVRLRREMIKQMQ